MYLLMPSLRFLSGESTTNWFNCSRRYYLTASHNLEIECSIPSLLVQSNSPSLSLLEDLWRKPQMFFPHDSSPFLFNNAVVSPSPLINHWVTSSPSLFSTLHFLIKDILTTSPPGFHRGILSSCSCPRTTKRALFHSDPFLLINSNQIAAVAFNFISISNAVIFYYAPFPTMQ